MIDEKFAEAQAAVLARHDVEFREQLIDIPVVNGQGHVVVTGSGHPIVLLNGIGTPAAMWAPLTARLEGFTHYAVDLPAYGLTDTTPDFADDLRANAVQFLIQVLDGLGLDRPVIVGNSLGSLWSSWLALDHPDRVAGLAHIGCPAIVLDTSAPLPMRLLSVRTLGRLMMKVRPPSERQVEELSKMVHEHPLPAEIADVILATERLDHFEGTFLATLNGLVRLRGSRPEMALTGEQLARIAVPTLLVFARNDPMGDDRVGHRVAAAMRNAELHIVDGGHVPWIHHADQIAPPLTAFLARTAGRPGV